jgi:hypothetical protein
MTRAPDPADPVPRYLADAVHAHKRASRQLAQTAAARDEAIRRAADEGVARSSIVTTTGMCRQRVLQIRSASR